MSPRAQVHLASVAVALNILVISGLLLLAFYVPKLVAAWANWDVELAWWQVWLANASNLATRHGFVPLVLLLVLFIAALAWRVLAAVRLRRVAA